jgi:hypothetical protein
VALPTRGQELAYGSVEAAFIYIFVGNPLEIGEGTIAIKRTGFVSNLG